MAALVTLMGFLDRLDSVVFAAPIFFHVTRYAWAV